MATLLLFDSLQNGSGNLTVIRNYYTCRKNVKHLVDQTEVLVPRKQKKEHMNLKQAKKHTEDITSSGALKNWYQERAAAVESETDFNKSPGKS